VLILMSFAMSFTFSLIHVMHSHHVLHFFATQFHPTKACARISHNASKSASVNKLGQTLGFAVGSIY
jgi:hypothetical protein